MDSTHPEVTPKLLRDKVGISDGYAFDLANGHREPSLKMAIRIREATGIPVEIWPLPEKEKVARAPRTARAA